MATERDETTDPAGRRVVFDRRTKAHLVLHRAWMLEHTQAILDVVHSPDLHEDDPKAGRERFYRRDLDGRRWLRVVVDFNELPAFVVTALVQDYPPGENAR